MTICVDIPEHAAAGPVKLVNPLSFIRDPLSPLTTITVRIAKNHRSCTPEPRGFAR